MLRGVRPSSQNLLWHGFLTPEGSEGVPTNLRILHDMIARLQENKIRKREVSISTYTIRYDQPQTSFSRAPPPREVYRISPGQLLCQTLLTRAPGNHLGTLHRKIAPSDLFLLPFSHKTFLAGYFLYKVPKWFPWARVSRVWHKSCPGLIL